IERPEVAQFSDQQISFVFARAYKGEGKSALLRLARRKIAQHQQRDLFIIARTATELSPECTKDDYPTWLRAWKAAILGAFATEIGSRLGIAWTDDAMSLVEEAEKTGHRTRSFFSAIADRLQLPKAADERIPHRTRVGTPNPAETVRRWVEGKAHLWLFVDDVDKNLRHIDSDMLRVATFFDACRELINAVPELRVRSAIRPNVWTIIRRHFESMSHVNQYAVDLQWSESDIRTMLASRIKGYLERNRHWQRVSRTLPADTVQREKATIGLAFDSPMRWGSTTRPPHVVLYTLSKHRPRWVIELSKAAAKRALASTHAKITKEDVFAELKEFGKRRIADTISEFRSQCQELEELLMAFSREKEQLATNELFSIIDRKILTHLTPKIAGITAKPTPTQVASLLFEVGLYYGRRQLTPTNYEHISYADSPHLLASRTDLDAGLSWEIHPVFRQALDMRDAGGMEITRNPNYWLTHPSFLADLESAGTS
ncbi:MAG: hypothetical protein WCA19_14840, partial [Candidatus Acidiferrales bacterium]